LLCPECGGRFEAVSGRRYGCATRRKSGLSVCSNPLTLRMEVFDETVLRLLDGEVLHPLFIDQVLNLACGNRGEGQRETVETQIAELTAAIGRLIALAEAGADDVTELAMTIKVRTSERDALTRRLSALAEPTDRASLKAALEQRVADWRRRLRAEHPAEARFVVQRLIGPLTLWAGIGTDEPPAYAQYIGSPLGAEAIEFSDCGFSAQVTPAGLLNSLSAHIMVAGGRVRHGQRASERPLHSERCSAPHRPLTVHTACAFFVL